MKFLFLTALLLAASGSSCRAAERDARRLDSQAIEQFSFSWFGLPPLPRTLQTNCRYHGDRLICSDNCGSGYQKYFCSPQATGCCHVGHGYCDVEGHLRCMPGF